MALKRPSWPSGRVVTLGHTSRVLKDNPLGDPYVRTLDVWLPPQYDAAKGPGLGERFPVLFDLVGFTGSGRAHTAWRNFDENVPERAARLVHDGKMAPAIIVFPDCFTAFGGNQYVNSSAVGRYADYLTRELELILVVVGGVQTLLLGFLHEHLAHHDLLAQLPLHLGRDRAAGRGQLLRQHVHARLGNRLSVDDGSVLRKRGHGQGAQEAAVEHAQVAELIGVGDQDGGEPGRDQQGDRDQCEQLAGARAQLFFFACAVFALAPALFFLGCGGGGGGGRPAVGRSLMSSTRSVASPSLRSSCPVKTAGSRRSS